jgi:hypothetical protein
MNMAPDVGVVDVVSSEELDEGIAVALRDLGMTFDELGACALRREFPNERARLVWFMIAPDERVACC